MQQGKRARLEKKGILVLSKDDEKREIEFELDERNVDRFRNEIKLTRKISHRNVYRMHELHQDRNQMFIFKT